MSTAATGWNKISGGILCSGGGRGGALYGGEDGGVRKGLVWWMIGW